MAAAAMLDFGFRAFFDILYALLLGAATFLSRLVKIGHEMREWYQFSGIQDGGNRHVGFLSPGSYQYSILQNVLLFIVATFLPNLVKIGEKLRERYHFFAIQDGCGRHFEDLTSG